MIVMEKADTKGPARTRGGMAYAILKIVARGQIAHGPLKSDVSNEAASISYG